MESPAPIHLLPNEMLVQIFSYLRVPDRLIASLVCKKWLETVNDHSLMKDVVVKINQHCVFSLFLLSSRKFVNFHIQSSMVKKCFYKLIESFSSNIEYLCIENCENNVFPYYLTIVNKERITFKHLSLDNLKVLKIINSDLLKLLPALPNLDELYLSGDFTEKQFVKLQKFSKHLRSFTLLHWERDLYKRYHNGVLKYGQDHFGRLSFSTVCNFISENANTLKELHIFPILTPSALTDVSSLKDLHLHKIDLTNRSCADGLIDLFQNQPTLKVIILNDVDGMNDDIIDALCSLLPNAEEILIHGNAITQSLKNLFHMTKLHTLDISGGRALSAKSFNEAILNFRAVHLKSLKLHQKLKEAEKINFYALFKKCKNLKFLDISCNEINDTAMHAISENLTQLEHLLVRNSKISDRGLGDTYCSLSNLRKLKELDLSMCIELTENALINTIKFNYLEYLFLGNCDLLECTVELLRKQNPSIKVIYWLNHKLLLNGRRRPLNDILMGNWEECPICDRE